MALAGYDPRAAFDLWDLMSAVEKDAEEHGSPASFTDKFSLLQTHPPSQVRQEVGAGPSTR
jgi:predicted Zn-dependent protease